MTKINKEGWEIKKLGEVCTIERGGSPRPIQNFITDSDDGLNWIKIGDAVEGSKYITKTAEKIIPEGLKKTRWVEKGDFILSNSMSFGRPYILEIDGCIHDGWLVIHGVEDFFNKDFLYYYLSSPIVYATFKKMAVGGVVNNLNSRMVRDLNVPIPKRKIQQRIVDELDEINAIISAKKQQLTKLDELAQSIFYDMFGDPVANEKGWEVKKLGEITTKLGSGATPRGGNQAYKAEGVSLIRSLNVHNNEFVYRDLAHIDDEQAKSLNGVTIEENDILLNITGASVARSCIVPADVLPARVNQHVCIIRVTGVVVNYLARLLTSKPFQVHLIALATSKAATREALPKKLVEGLNIPLPPLPLQETFATRISAIEDQKSAIAASIEKMQTLLDARMQEYFG